MTRIESAVPQHAISETYKRNDDDDDDNKKIFITVSMYLVHRARVGDTYYYKINRNNVQHHNK